MARRKTERYRQWREEVYKRDNYTCRACDRKDVYLNAHHLKPYSRFPLERYNLSNGITLCGSCHQQFHTTYGVPDDERYVYYFIVHDKKTLAPPTGKYGPRKKFKNFKGK